VVLIDIEIADGLERQIERPMARHQFQHVVEEADATGNVRAAMAFQGECDVDLGFVGLAVNAGASHAVTSLPSSSSRTTSPSAAMSWVVCTSLPMVMRTQPAQPGSLERSRTRTARCRMADTNS